MDLFLYCFSLSFCFSWMLIHWKLNVIQIFSMSMWNYGPDVVDALLDLIISLVSGFSFVWCCLMDYILELLWQVLCIFHLQIIAGCFKCKICWFMFRDARRQFHASLFIHSDAESATWYYEKGPSPISCSFSFERYSWFGASFTHETIADCDTKKATLLFSRKSELIRCYRFGQIRRRIYHNFLCLEPFAPLHHINFD